VFVELPEIVKDDTNFNDFIGNRIKNIQNIIINTIISIKNNKEIFSNNDIILSISILTELYEKTKELNIKKEIIMNEKTKDRTNLANKQMKE
jgi:hypothetical protein